MSLKQFLPFLTNDQGRSLTLENGVPVTRAIPDPLDNSPEGWEKNVIQYARSNEFRGLIKSYTTSLKFYLDGAKILRDYFYRKGMEVVLFFIWLKLDQTFGGELKHKSWYKGEPDFSTFKDTEDGVEINITEGGFYKELQANKGVPYTIPFDDDAVSIEMDGINVNETSNFETQTNTYAPSALWSLLGLTFLNKEGTATGITQYTVFPQPSATNFNYSTNLNYFLRTENAVTPHFKFKIKFEVTLGATLVDIHFKTQTRLYQLVPAVSYARGYHEFSFDFDWALLAGETVFLVMNKGGAITQFVKILQEPVQISYVTRRPTNVITAFRIFDLGNKLVKQMSNNVSSLQSDLLSNDYNLMVTSGDAIRKIPGAAVKTKFQSWHKSVDAVKCIALDIVNNNPVVESRYDKFTDTTILDLGPSRNFSLDVAKEYIYDVVEAGYNAQDTEDVNGKYSFMNKFVWKAPVTKVKNLYDIVSEYYADPYVIELIRINLENKTTTDGSTDNDVFFMDCEKVFTDYVGDVEITSDGTFIFQAINMGLINGIRFKSSTGNNVGGFTVIYSYEVGATTIAAVTEPVTAESLVGVTIEFLHYRLRRPAFTVLTGVFDETVFNVMLSPKRMLMAHYRWIRSALDHSDHLYLKFQTTEKNADLVTELDGVTITEKEDVLIGAMGDKVYLPYYLNFEVASPHNLLEAMEANSNGYFKSSTDDIDVEGFVIQISTDDTMLETQEYKLLASPNNDLTLLINGR